MGDTLDEFGEILRQAMKHTGSILDNDCTVDVDMHLQETIMLLHKVTLKALNNIEDHILSLSSRKRAEFIASGCMLDESDLNIRKMLQGIRVAISRKAVTEFDIVQSEFERYHQTVVQIKGLSRYTGVLTWLGLLHKKIVDLDSHASVLERKEIHEKCLHNIAAQIQEWLQRGLEKFQNDLSHLQTPVLSIQQDSMVVQFHQGLRSGLIEIFFLHKMGLVKYNKCLMDVSRVYYDAMATFHKMKYLVHRSTNLVDKIHAFSPPIAIQAKSQISEFVNAELKSVTWMSAPVSDFMQRFQLQVGKLKSIKTILQENRLSLASLGIDVDQSLQFEYLMNQNDGCALDDAMKLVVGIIKESLSIYHPAR